MKFLSIILTGNGRSLAMYNAQYADVFNSSKSETSRATKFKVPANDILEPGKNDAQNDRAKRPRINYFAGPHCVFNPSLK